MRKVLLWVKCDICINSTIRMFYQNEARHKIWGINVNAVSANDQKYVNSLVFKLSHTSTEKKEEKKEKLTKDK